MTKRFDGTDPLAEAECDLAEAESTLLRIGRERAKALIAVERLRVACKQAGLDHGDLVAQLRAAESVLAETAHQATIAANRRADARQRLAAASRGAFV